MLRHTAILLAIAWSAGAENLLENAGFEAWHGAKAGPWKSFVMPQPGATAGRESTAHSGEWAAVLHTPQPYERDPANNWSQSVSRPLSGKRLVLSGFVKTREATEAALWLQCWRKPSTLVDFVTSSTSGPVSGTQDWRDVSASMKIPEGTDFVVVRCVLLGCGTAWFDDMALSEVEEPTAGLPEESGPEEEAASVAGAEPAVDRARIEQLLDAQATLKQTVNELQNTNDALMEQLWLLYEEVKDLRDEVGALKQAATHVEASVSSPLVPIERTPTEDAP
ncbi:MAG TPA: cell division protein ZapB [Candidatus Hydrogenedentes bacterium]|nr:cell division protein ZapB [Candidatus Hydrogenedentota bacterium]